MRIVVAGGTGFLGRQLVRRLQGASHAVTVLSREPREGVGVTHVPWTPDGTAGSWAGAIDGADAVVNLSGAPLVGRRWTAAVKRALADSRVLPTRSLVAAIDEAAARPRVLVNASAVGYYGPHGDDQITEETPAGSGYLASLCKEWENAALAAEPLGTRVVTLRSGLVLARGGGALARMLLPFRLGLGGRLGTGRQYWPWIHGEDWTALVELVLNQPQMSGPINLTAPAQVTNAEFTAALAQAMHRPAIVPVPAVALWLVFGELANEMLLTGQRALPARALALGYRFAYENLASALGQIVAADQ